MLLGGLCGLVGWRAVLVVQLPTAMLAGAAGIWLFYVQHQFEDTTGSADGLELRRSRAARQLLPEAAEVLQFFTGNIGLHHVHHLSARIPNYNLQRAHDENPIFHDVPTTDRLGRRARRAAQALGRGPRPDGHLREARAKEAALSSATPMS